MVHESDQMRHYRVVRFYSHFGHGLMKDVIGANLSLEEAEELLNQNLDKVAGEDIVIQDQNKIGLEAEVLGGHTEEIR